MNYSVYLYFAARHKCPVYGITVEAESADEAKTIAMHEARRDGFPEHIKKAEVRPVPNEVPA